MNIYWLSLPTITTNSAVIEIHREKTIRHQEHCKQIVQRLIWEWMDEMQAKLALPYYLHKEELGIQ